MNKSKNKILYKKTKMFLIEHNGICDSNSLLFCFQKPSLLFGASEDSCTFIEIPGKFSKELNVSRALKVFELVHNAGTTRNDGYFHTQRGLFKKVSTLASGDGFVRLDRFGDGLVCS